MKLKKLLHGVCAASFTLATLNVMSCSSSDEEDEELDADAAKVAAAPATPTPAPITEPVPEPTPPPAPAAPTPPPAPKVQANGVANGVVRYVSTDGSIFGQPNSAAPVVGSVVKGDNLYVQISGDWAKLGEGRFVPTSILTPKAIGRRKGSGTWQAAH